MVEIVDLSQDLVEYGRYSRFQINLSKKSTPNELKKRSITTDSRKSNPIANAVRIDNKNGENTAQGGANEPETMRIDPRIPPASVQRIIPGKLV